MSSRTFTGERLHAGDDLFAVDLARHEAAYEIAHRSVHHTGARRVLELGSGAGYGAALLADREVRIVGIDRVGPDPRSRRGPVVFVRGDLNHIPLAGRSFELVVSFQVIEHLEDPTAYVDALADLVREDGHVLVTTPNRLTSDGVNPFHVHEYKADELGRCLGRRFAVVDVQGIGASEPVRAYMDARSARIRRIMRLDPLRLRDRLPRALVERLFAAFALQVRRGTQSERGTPDVGVEDFPVGPETDDCLDLLAICRRPR